MYLCSEPIMVYRSSASKSRRRFIQRAFWKGVQCATQGPPGLPASSAVSVSRAVSCFTTDLDTQFDSVPDSSSCCMAGGGGDGGGGEDGVHYSYSGCLAGGGGVGGGGVDISASGITCCLAAGGGDGGGGVDVAAHPDSVSREAFCFTTDPDTQSDSGARLVSGCATEFATQADSVSRDASCLASVPAPYRMKRYIFRRKFDSATRVVSGIPTDPAAQPDSASRDVSSITTVPAAQLDNAAFTVQAVEEHGAHADSDGGDSDTPVNVLDATYDVLEELLHASPAVPVHLVQRWAHRCYDGYSDADIEEAISAWIQLGAFRVNRDGLLEHDRCHPLFGRRLDEPSF
jgi:hypothetical protein